MTTTTRLSPMEMDAIAARHPELLKSSTSKRVRTATIAGGIVVYAISVIDAYYRAGYRHERHQYVV